MTAPAVKGWCPGAYRPMEAADGLVVRVRPPAGELSAAQLRGLAELAEAHGTGEVQLTSRANLQLRGISHAAHDQVLEALWALGLLDEDPDVEGRRNIVVDPLRRYGDGQLDMARALADGLAQAEFAGLPSKFGFVIDAGDVPCLANVSADIRIERAGDTLMVQADGSAHGRAVSDAVDAVRVALGLARWFLDAGGVGRDGRGRMRALVARGVTIPASLSGPVQIEASRVSPNPGPFAGGLLLGAAFGQIACDALRGLAQHTESLRITPWRMVFLPGIAEVSVPSLIANPDDPLLRVVACVGAPHCAQAQVETRGIAAQLASHISNDQILHVSGCAKGCAHPSKADVTLTGRDGLFDLVAGGAPWDEPRYPGLTPDELSAKIGG